MLMLLNWPLELGSYQLYTVQNLGLRLHVFAGTCYKVSVSRENCGIFRVLSRNEFFGGEDGKEEVYPRWGSGAFPQESVIVPLSEHIY